MPTTKPIHMNRSYATPCAAAVFCPRWLGTARRLEHVAALAGRSVP